MKLEFSDQPFIPLIFGSDINTYSVARAFYEQYQVKSYVLGKVFSGPSVYSKIINFIVHPNMEQDEVMIEHINKIAAENPAKTIITFGAGDDYVAHLSKNRARFLPNVLVHAMDYKVLSLLQDKAYFYETCQALGVAYPDTIIHRPADGFDFEIPFTFPVVLKPAVSSAYWEHPFPDNHKVFFLKDRPSLIKQMKTIYEAGYPEALIIQDRIPGNDEYMYVLTAYINQRREIKMLCLGHTLLEEHSPWAIGNHAVVITEYNEQVLEDAKKLLLHFGYTGYANFDIKLDRRDGRYKFFEINTRQGRSNYYVTGSGLNLAKYVVDDFITKEDRPAEIARDSHLWSVIPLSVARKYVKEPNNLKQMNELIKAGKVVNPLFFKPDNHWKRWLRIMKTHLSHISKFRKYYHE